MARRVRLLLTAVLVGTGILVMHVELAPAVNEGHAAAALDSHEDCGSHCGGESRHRGHLMADCSMVLLVLAAIGVVLLVARRSGSARPARPAEPLRHHSPLRLAPERPPDLAALAVMRC